MTLDINFHPHSLDYAHCEFSNRIGAGWIARSSTNCIYFVKNGLAQPCAIALNERHFFGGLLCHTDPLSLALMNISGVGLMSPPNSTCASPQQPMPLKPVERFIQPVREPSHDATQAHAGAGL